MARPMLGDLELQQVQQIEVDEDQVLVHHQVPELEGDFHQRLGRRAASVALSGVLTGPDVGDGLKKLRERFRTAEAVPFTADIATATSLSQVLIEEMGVRDLAGKPQRFEYAFRLREFIPSPPPETTPPPPVPPPPPPRVETGTLIVEVEVEGEPDFDFSTVTVTVRGTQEDGTVLSRTLTNRTGNRWEEDEFPPGTYRADALVTDPQPMTGSGAGRVQAGQTTTIPITLKPGAVIATAFVVHFRFDNSFVEPCMRRVLRQVMAHAESHADDRLIVVGHTDKTGSEDYNQSLSERRARSVFAYLTSGRDPANALAEWTRLRQRATGGLPSIEDTWGTNQYQYMLQDLGFYPGNVDGDHGEFTDEAVQSFRAAHGLPPGTTVDDAVWDALILAYLQQDADVMKLAEDRLLPNASPGCDGGPIKWLGCGELSPLPEPKPPTEKPHRQYRRVELLFVRATGLLCQVPKPVTFDLPPGPGGVSWCLGPGKPKEPCCFASRTCDTSGRFCIVDAEKDEFVVRVGFIREDESPVPDVKYVLIAPDGEFMDGEVVSPPRRGQGESGKSGTDGTHTYATNKGPGVYTLEVKGPFIARPKGEPLSAAKGNVVCKRLESGSPLVVILLPGGKTAPAVSPVITPASSAVVIKKPFTSPARQKVTLKTDGPFFRSGTFTISSPVIRIFTDLTAGTEITFDGTDNVFTGAQLTAGVDVFAEGATPSAAPDDVVLTLDLTRGVTPVGPAATATMTSVELTLDICLSRTTPGVDPVPMSTADKINPGRFLAVQDPGNHQERAMLIVRPPIPAGFLGDLSLSALTRGVQVFSAEVAGPGQVPLADPDIIPAATIPPGGFRLFAQGAAASTAVRDTGFRLGLKDLEPDGDRVIVTVVQIEIVDSPTPVAPASSSTRMGLWDHAFDAAGTLFNNEAEADNFVGADSRRFHFRVRDPSKHDRLDVVWRTTDATGANLDAPANRTITLLETVAGSGVFLSKGLMLVTDADDQKQDTHSGLPAGVPDSGSKRKRDETNHRTRRTSMTGEVIGEYLLPSVNPAIVRLPAFQRAPDERRRMPVQIFVLRVAVGGGGIIPTAPGTAVWATDLRVMRETYERIGIQVDTVVRPGTLAANIAVNGADRLVLIDPPAGVNPANLSFADEAAIGTANPAIADTIRLFFVGGLSSGAGGETWTDAITTAADSRRGAAFSIQATGPYAAAHEVGHAVSNKGGGAHYREPALPAGHRLHNDQNLMKQQPLGPERVNGPKRLWDAVDGDAFNQFTAMRGSHYTRAF